jgi:SAM-dependent methyltransferase
MIFVKSILESLEKYKKEEFETEYLNECIEYFKNLKELKKINSDKYLLTGVKLNLLYNRDKYFVYFSDKRKKNSICYRKFDLDKTQANNLVNQLNAIKINNYECKDIVKTKNNTFYLSIVDKKIKNDNDIIIDNYYEIISLLLGIQSFFFLRHQNLDNYCRLLLNKENTVIKEFYKFKELIKNLSWQEKDRLLLFSGMIFHFLGTIYTEDIDILYVLNNDNDKDKYLKLFKDHDAHLIMEKTVVKTAAEALPYLHRWMKYDLPQLGGAENIYTVLINPEHHFHYNGVKCLDLLSNIQRVISRSNAFAFIDIYLLKKLNNLDFQKNFCIKNISIRGGKAHIFNEESMKFINEKVRKYLLKWYNIELSEKEINQHLQKCDKIFDTIYYKKINYMDLHIKHIVRYNRNVLNYYLKGDNANKKLLDIGSGKCSGFFNYVKYGIKDIVGIEPSIYSIDACKAMNEKFDNRVKIKLYQGFGDQKWNNEVYKNKYDYIVLNFTIHYMINNLDILIENIKKVANKGCKIFITFINGYEIFNKLKNDKYEIYFNKEPVYGVYKYNESIPNTFNNSIKMLFYFKDIYGLSNGSEEYLINPDYLIEKFSDFKLLIRNNFLDLKNNNFKFNFQREILKLNQLLIFEV